MTDPTRWSVMRVGPEPQKSMTTRLANGFYAKYCQGKGVDVGYGGGRASPFQPHAIGIDKDTKYYDGVRLPFDDLDLDFVFSSHCLEHVPRELVGFVLQDWYRALKIGGHMIIIVPHKWLYEKTRQLPSRYNTDHKWFITPAKLLKYVEWWLPINGYRIRWMRDNDDNFDYSLGPKTHSTGCYEIELVLQKIAIPDWEMD